MFSDPIADSILESASGLTPEEQRRRGEDGEDVRHEKYAVFVKDADVCFLKIKECSVSRAQDILRDS